MAAYFPAHAQTPSPSPSPSSSSSPNASPSASPLTIFENVTLDPGFTPDPTTVRGISGGSLTAGDIAGRAETATGPCNGFVDEQPDHTIVLNEFFNYLSLQVQSPEDTTLVIRGPGGTWCNDDYADQNPGIAGQWLSGTYQIWIGSYEPETYHPYVIRISETR
ncbi:MAG: hypothetical protein HC769_13660 [Cyanobacteria bacterium CRU_2_1]|nr:hypothetical protein [Cyanobacteria bacterium CRU_2_1]